MEQQPTTRLQRRTEEFFRKRGIQWLLSKYPAASAIDIRLFALGWDRCRHHTKGILEELQREAP
jgi:hypothetical protein